MNSHRPRSQNTAKEQALIPEKDSKRKRPRCHVSLEKSSKNYKTLEKWAKPNPLPDVTPQPANCIWQLYLAGLPRGEARTARISCRFHQPNKLAKGRGEGGVNRGLIYLINGLTETSPIQNEDSQWCAAPFLFRQVWSKCHGWSRASFGGFI